MVSLATLRRRRSEVLRTRGTAVPSARTRIDCARRRRPSSDLHPLVDYQPPPPELQPMGYWSECARRAEQIVGRTGGLVATQ
jgi:hypothetical protein